MLGRFARSSHATVVAYAALFVALGGTSYAAIKLPANSVKSRQIAPKAVGSSELRNESVTSRKLSDSVLRRLEARQGPAGPQGAPGVPGPNGPQGSTGPVGPVGQSFRSEIVTRFGDPVDVAPGETTGPLLAECSVADARREPLFKVTGGGSTSKAVADGRLVPIPSTVEPTTRTEFTFGATIEGWTFRATNTSSVTVRVTPYVICLRERPA